MTDFSLLNLVNISDKVIFFIVKLIFAIIIIIEGIYEKNILKLILVFILIGILFLNLIHLEKKNKKEKLRNEIIKNNPEIKKKLDEDYLLKIDY